MSTSTDKIKAVSFLQGLETGSMPPAKSQMLAQDLDAVLVYFTVRFLRETYPASNPAASAVLERLMKLTSAYPDLVAKCKEGGQDPVSAWFTGEYDFRDFRGRGREMLEMIVDKLES